MGQKYNLGLFCREFYDEFSGFYQIEKFQAVFELWPETRRKMAIFDPRKPLNLAYFRGFWELYCSKLLQIWFVNVFLLVLTEFGEKF